MIDIDIRLLSRYCVSYDIDVDRNYLRVYALNGSMWLPRLSLLTNCLGRSMDFFLLITLERAKGKIYKPIHDTLASHRDGSTIKLSFEAK